MKNINGHSKLSGPGLSANEEAGMMTGGGKWPYRYVIISSPLPTYHSPYKHKDNQKHFLMPVLMSSLPLLSSFFKKCVAEMLSLFLELSALYYVCPAQLR